MALIQCTKKLLDNLSVEVRTDQSKPSILGNWHANLVVMQRRKCVLFTNDLTLYSLFIPKITKPDFKNLISIFMTHLTANLVHEGLDKYSNMILKEYEDNLHFSKSSNRSVLGSMNDLVKTIYFRLYHNIEENVDSLLLNRELNQTPLKAIKYNDAIECLQRELKKYDQ